MRYLYGMSATQNAAPSAAPRLVLTPHEEREVAVHAGVDPRTVRKFLAHGAVTSTCAARIEAALRESLKRQR